MNRKEFIKGIGLVAGAAAFGSRAKAACPAPCDCGTGGGAAGTLPNRVLGSGRAAMSVSTLGFGCMGLTYNRSQHPDKKQMSRLLARAVDCGVTLFDTAIVYGPLENERTSTRTCTRSISRFPPATSPNWSARSRPFPSSVTATMPNSRSAYLGER